LEEGGSREDDDISLVDEKVKLTLRARSDNIRAGWFESVVVGWSVATDGVWEVLGGGVSVESIHEDSITDIELAVVPVLSFSVLWSPDDMSVLSESDWLLMSEGRESRLDICDSIITSNQVEFGVKGIVSVASWGEVRLIPSIFVWIGSALIDWRVVVFGVVGWWVVWVDTVIIDHRRDWDSSEENTSEAGERVGSVLNESSQVWDLCIVKSAVFAKEVIEILVSTSKVVLGKSNVPVPLDLEVNVLLNKFNVWREVAFLWKSIRLNSDFGLSSNQVASYAKLSLPAACLGG
jgi:hypothetical protein